MATSVALTTRLDGLTRRVDGALAGEQAGRIVHATMLVAAVLVGTAILSPAIVDPDLWGHVVYGRDLLRDGLPETTTYSYTAIGRTWINHENLAEIVLAVLADGAGARGLLVGKAIAAAAVLVALLAACRRRQVPWPFAMGWMLLVAAALPPFWTVRPQVGSWLGYAALLTVFDVAFLGWNGRWPRIAGLHQEPGRGELISPSQPLGYSSRRLRLLWLVVPLFAIWANTHGGFAAGVAVLVAYLIGRTLEAFVHRGGQGWGLARRFALMAGAGLLATFLNPYGPGLHQWMIGALGVPRPEITEWAATNAWQAWMIPSWAVLGLAALGLAWTKRRIDGTHLFVLAATAIATASHHRHLPFLVYGTAFWLSGTTFDGLRRLGAFPPVTLRWANLTPTERRTVAFGAILVLLVGFVIVERRTSSLPVDRAKWPVDAFAYMGEHGLTGRTIVTMNWAQYAIDAFGSTHPDSGLVKASGSTGQATPDADAADAIVPFSIMFDGRFRTAYPQAVLDAHFDLVLAGCPAKGRYRDLASGPIVPSRALRLGEPELVVLCRTQEGSVAVLSDHQDVWCLLYQDGLAQVWGRRSVFDDPRSSRYLPPSARQVGDSPRSGVASWPARPVLALPQNTFRPEPTP